MSWNAKQQRNVSLCTTATAADVATTVVVTEDSRMGTTVMAGWITGEAGIEAGEVTMVEEDMLAPEADHAAEVAD